MSKLKRLLSIVLTISLLCTTFLSTGMIAHASMLPLREQKAYLVLNGYSNDQLSAMSMDIVLSMLEDTNGNSIEISSDATTVWHYIKDAEDGLEVYKPYTIGNNEIMDLSYHNSLVMSIVILKNLSSHNISHIFQALLRKGSYTFENILLSE